MTWAEYQVTFAHTEQRRAIGSSALLDRVTCKRYIRATSERDARYRVVRKYILPADAEIVSVERLSN